MSIKCSICIHDNSDQINSQLVANVPLRTISKQWSVSKTALIRHKDAHIPETLSKAAEAVEVAQAETLLDQLQGLRGRAMGILDRAEKSDDLRAACGAIREARGCLELLGKLAGELREGVSITVNQGADMAMLARLIDAGLCAGCRLKIVEMERAVTGEWRTE